MDTSGNNQVEPKDVKSYWLKNWGSRDLVFRYVIDKLPKHPLKILEVGTTRNSSAFGRFSDGWSTFWWYSFVCEHGGVLDVVDIDKAALDNVRAMLEGFGGEGQVRLIEGDASLYLNLPQNRDHDFVFLDGGDDPGGMLVQFAKINRERTSMILCDDFHVKGHLLRKLCPDFLLFKWKDGHEMALYSNDIKAADTINIVTH